MRKLKDQIKMDIKKIDELRKKPIFFLCSVCGKSIKNEKDLIQGNISNPSKVKEPTWQIVWMHKKCCKKVFKILGSDLVIMGRNIGVYDEKWNKGMFSQEELQEIKCLRATLERILRVMDEGLFVDYQMEKWGKIMKHGIDCDCEECKKIKNLIKDKVQSGEVYLSGTEEDKKKIMET